MFIILSLTNITHFLHTLYLKMVLTHVVPFLQTNLPKLTTVPDDLKDYVHTANADVPSQSPWWLAERIVVSSLSLPQLEQDVVALLECIRKAMTEDDVFTHLFDIADKLFDVMEVVLSEATLKNAFSEENALITVYFTTVFMVCCAYRGQDENNDGVDDGEAMVTAIRKYEDIWVRLARLATKLLQNRQVYEFVSDLRQERCAPVVSKLYTFLSTCRVNK
jgi:hypothetical protein